MTRKRASVIRCADGQFQTRVTGENGAHAVTLSPTWDIAWARVGELYRELYGDLPTMRGSAADGPRGREVVS